MATGIEWAFLQDFETDTHALVGLGYELGIADKGILKNEDEVRLWGSYNRGFDRQHLCRVVDSMTPIGSEDIAGDADRLCWHIHADYWVSSQFCPVAEFNGYYVIGECDNTPLPFSGFDVQNQGGGEGEAVITNGLGLEWRFSDSLALRGAYEHPHTDNVDLFGDRYKASLVWAL